MPDFAVLSDWKVVLVSPQTPENVGAVARLVNNFGCSELAVVDPRCDISPEGRAGVMACWSTEVLAHARVFATLDEALADCHFSVALTMMGSEDRPVDYVGFSPKELLAGHSVNEKRAVVFGREDRGLTNEECSRTTARWAIPTNPATPSLNLAQAVAIALAGIASVCDQAKPEEETVDLATQQDIDGLVQHLAQVLEAIDFERGVPVEQTLRQLRRAALRGQLRLGEVRTIRGIFRRTLNKILGYERRS